MHNSFWYINKYMNKLEVLLKADSELIDLGELKFWISN